MAFKKLGAMQCTAEKSVQTSNVGNGNSEGNEGSMAEIADMAGRNERESWSVMSRVRMVEGSTKRRRELVGAEENPESIKMLPSKSEARVAAGETSSSISMRCKCILRFLRVAI